MVLKTDPYCRSPARRRSMDFKLAFLWDLWIQIPKERDLVAGRKLLLLWMIRRSWQSHRCIDVNERGLGGGT